MKILIHFTHGSYYALVDGELWRMSSFSCRKNPVLFETVENKISELAKRNASLLISP